MEAEAVVVTTATAPLRGPLRKRDSHLWQRHAQDWYAEPAWCSERLFELERFEGEIIDPACGFGRIVHSAHDAGYSARGYDIAERPGGWPVGDFMQWRADFTIENIVCNPPFGIAERFVSRALELTQRKVAMLLPANWVQGDKRSRWLECTPLKAVHFITPRPSMPPGPIIQSGVKPGCGTTDYAWFIWERGYTASPQIGWCRRDA